MPTLARKGLPEVWPSGIAALLAGEASCGFQPWFKAHFRYDKIPGSFDFANWKIEHTALLERTRSRLKADGWTCSMESQNSFKLTGTTCALIGKPDIIARKAKAIRVVDCKTGAAKDAHGVQVGIYMIAIPLAWERPTLYVEGEIAYKDSTVHIAPEEVQGLKPRLFQLLREMGSAERPATVPSEPGCRYCDIAEVDCPSRWSGPATPDVLTTEF